MIAPRPDRAERFWAMADRSGGPEACWPWRAFRAPNGYGRIGRSESAHRFAYEMLVGPIAPGLTIDHLCRNRACVNPAHLEAVTSGENVLRGIGPSAVNAQKARCKNGHLFDEANTFRYSKGRICRTCRRAYDRKQYALAKAAGASPDDPQTRTL